MKRPAPAVPSSAPSARVPPPSAAPPPSPEDGSAAAPANGENSYFDSFYNWMVDPSLDPNAAAAAQEGKQEGAEEGGSYWDSFVGGLEYTKESVGAVVAYSYPSGGTEGGEGAANTQGPAPPGSETNPDGAPQESSWDNVTRQTTEATGAIGQSLSTWYYGKEAEEEGGERKPGFQDTLGSYAAYMYPSGQAEDKTGEAAPEGEQKPVDPNAPYLGSWFLPEEKEGEPVRIEKVDLDGMVTGFFSGTGTALQKMADYGPAPPSRVKPPASPVHPTPPRSPATATSPSPAAVSSPSPAAAASPVRPATGTATAAPRRPPSQQVFTSSSASKQAPPPRPSPGTKGMVSGGAAAPGRPMSSRPLPKTTPPSPQTKTYVSSSSSATSFVKPQTTTTTSTSTTNNPPWKRN